MTQSFGMVLAALSSPIKKYTSISGLHLMETQKTRPTTFLLVRGGRRCYVIWAHLEALIASLTIA